jgi:hypothetical protein
MASKEERRKQQREKEREANLQKEQRQPVPTLPQGLSPLPGNDPRTSRKRELHLDGSLAVILALAPFGWQMLGFPNAPIAGVILWSVCIFFVGRICWIITDNLKRRKRWAISIAIPVALIVMLWKPVSHRAFVSFGDLRIVMYVMPNSEFQLLVESLGEPDRHLYIRVGFPSPVLSASVDNPERMHIDTGERLAPFSPSEEIYIPALAPHEKRALSFKVTPWKTGDIAVDASSERCGEHCRNVIIFDPSKFLKVRQIY